MNASYMCMYVCVFLNTEECSLFARVGSHVRGVSLRCLHGLARTCVVFMLNVQERERERGNEQKVRERKSKRGRYSSLRLCVSTSS